MFVFLTLSIACYEVIRYALKRISGIVPRSVAIPPNEIRCDIARACMTCVDLYGILSVSVVGSIGFHRKRMFAGRTTAVLCLFLIGYLCGVVVSSRWPACCLIN